MKIKKELRNGEGGRGLPTAHCSPSVDDGETWLDGFRLMPWDWRLPFIVMVTGPLWVGALVVVLKLSGCLKQESNGEQRNTNPTSPTPKAAFVAPLKSQHHDKLSHEEGEK